MGKRERISVCREVGTNKTLKNKCVNALSDENFMTPSGSTYPYTQCIGVPPPPSPGSDKAFKQGSSFYRFRGLFLQNEDPIDFASIGV